MSGPRPCKINQNKKAKQINKVCVCVDNGKYEVVTFSKTFWKMWRTNVRIDLPSNQIDSQIDSHLIVRIDFTWNRIDSQIDSHPILDGKTEFGIDNWFFCWAVPKDLELGGLPRLHVRIDLASTWIDSEIDSHLILDGRTEFGIDNRFFLGCSKGSGDRLIAQTPCENRFGFKPNRFSPNPRW